MKTKLYLATAEGLCIITGSNGNWNGDVRLTGKQVQCAAAGSRHPETVFCGTFGDGIFRSGNGGISWQSCGGFRQANVMSLALSDGEGSEGVIYAGTEPSALFQSGDRGETWSELPGFLNLPSAKQWSFPPRPQTHHVRYILPDPYMPPRLHVAIEAGALLRGEEGGQTWRDRVSGSRETRTRLPFTEVRPGASTPPLGTAISRVRTTEILGAVSLTGCSTNIVGAWRSASPTPIRSCLPQRKMRMRRM